VAALAALAYGWWATGLRPFSVGATAAILGAGVAAALLGRVAWTPRRARADTTAAATAPWVLAVATLAACELPPFQRTGWLW